VSLAWRLQRFLDNHGVDYHSGKRAFITTCLSPSCRKEDHCYIWKSDGGAICFRCGAKWRWRWMVAAIAGCPIDRAHEAFFGSGAGGEIHKAIDLDKLFAPDEPPAPEAEPVIHMPYDFIPLSESERGISYVVKRGIWQAPKIFQYDLRYHSLMDAVVFPIKRDDVLYGWQARRIDPQEGQLRLISHTFAKSKFLLNYDYAHVMNRIVLVEGPFDCLHVDLRNEGFAGVASLGKGVSRDQIKLLLDLPAKEVYLGLDPDASEEVYEVMGRIGLGKKIYRVKPPEHRKDFGECQDEETLRALDKAMRITGPSDFLEVYFK
jgi:hypothetical protein